MRGVAFAATPGWSGHACREDRAGAAPAQRCVALWRWGSSWLSARGSTAAERTGLQREIRETREFVAEIAKAVRRVQAENLKVQRTLGSEVRNLTAEDVTVTTLRLGRLDADTARLHVTTLENRIAQREATLRLLEDDINRRAADMQATPATTLATLGAQAELQQLRELRAVSIDLVNGLRDLRSAEAERLALAEERLAVLRSRAELRTIHEHGAFDRDPKVVAIRATISRLARDALRLDNEAGVTRPKSAVDPARNGLLQLQAGDAIIRSSVRVRDLELIGLANQLDFYGELIGDDSIPVAILDQARSELDGQRARLEDRLAALGGDRLTLEGQRELVRAQAAGSADSGALLLGPVQDLAELLDFQQADVTRLQQRLGEVAAKLDAEIGQREIGALREHRTLPANVGHWELVKRELIGLPWMTVDYWQGLLSDVVARLAALPPRGLVGLGGAILVLCGALWWLYRIGLQRVAHARPGWQAKRAAGTLCVGACRCSSRRRSGW